MNSKRTLSLSKKLKVLLIEADELKAKAFMQGLDSDKYQVDWLSNSGHSLLKAVESCEPDIVIIDVESPDRDTLDSLNHLSANAPKPVVMFSDDDNTNTINKMIKAGVSAYVAGGTDLTRVQSILETAIARFSEYQSLKQQLVETKQKLSSQKTIQKAKAWLMENKGYSEQDAYHFIRKTAMDNSQTMEAVAKNILSFVSVLGD
ncbi:ANTAR domain-containing response regulator [Thalassotalea agarivorans]|uniref:Response regulator receiver and ANTAR domain protein n=1 Tax=Thalassotalea agarivorans TaxID=349064 RepID=A0A1I0CTW7_THASX|nr:ANTAR domain-containing protein [Thalassotalea agarivorans]SET23257.1 response regulator receiver and ANTAR domain protein [Thalassotalea agarivorans]